MKEGYPPRMRIVGIAAVVVVAVVALAARQAPAQSPKPAGPAPSKMHSTVHPSPKKPVADAGASAPSVTTTPTPMPSASPPGGTPIDAGSGVVEAKTLDGGARVFKFSELDIEGRLKSPQLVYFLRRVRAEFAAGDLGHRSFLREMSETRKESTF
jgi:hypothetical protein